MRFLHTSDWHLGRTLHGVDLIDAQRAVLDQVCQIAVTEAVDAVLISGDVYDRAVPPVEAVSLFEDVLATLARVTTVIVTGGNHDSAIRLGFGSSLFTDRVHVRTSLDSIAEPVMVGDVAVYPLPYLDPDAARSALAGGPEPLPRSHQAVMSAAMDLVRADLAARPGATRSIVMAHAFVVGGAVSDSERSIVVGGVDSVAADTFAGLDYAALGHLHGPQQPQTSSDTILRYSGSPLRYSFSERTHTKSVTVLDLDADGVRARAVALTQPREMTELTGELAELLAGTAHEQEWVRITITDRSRPERMFDRIKARYPFVLQVFHVPAALATEAGTVRAATQHHTRAVRELGADFIRYVTGVEPLEAELDLFDGAFETATAQLAAAE